MSLIRSRYTRPGLRTQARSTLVWGSWALYVLGAEVLGRRSPDELHDALGVLALAAVVFLNAWVFLRSEHPWGRTLEERVAAMWTRVACWFPRVGVDLRETPPIKKELPQVFRVVLLFGWSLVALRMLAGPEMLAKLRAVLLPISPSLTFAFEALLWSVLLAGVLFLIGAAVVGVFLLLQRTSIPRRDDFQRAFLIGSAAYAVVILLFGIAFKSAVPMWVVGGLLLTAMVMAALPWHPSVLLLWRPRGPEFRLRGMEMRLWNHLCEWCAVGMFLGFSLAGFSASAAEPGAAQTPISAAMCMTLGWAGLGLAPIWMWFSLFSHLSSWFRNPARYCPTRLHVVGLHGRRAMRDLKRRLATAGIRARFAPARRLPGSLLLRVSGPDGKGAEPKAPSSLSFAAQDLEDPRVLEQILWRDVVQRRRQLRKGLEKALKAAKQHYSKGTGYLVAPHLWFAEGLGRDQEDDEHLDTCVGPRFHRVMPLTARNHFYEVLRALEVDLLFLEDGIRFRQLRSVLRTMFEVYDIHGGELPIAARHFQGIPGVRVILHELEPTAPWLHSDYPEPDFEDVGRARVLHVFRDRGDAEDDPVVDFDFDYVPDLPQVLSY